MLEKYEFPLKIENSTFTKEKTMEQSPLLGYNKSLQRKGKQNNKSEEKILRVSYWVIFL
jgi:hypothetical protein